jgi:hypothetical protein
MAILTDKQMLWIAGGAALLLYLAGHKVGEVIGGAVDAVGDVIGGAVGSVSKARNELQEKYQKIFLNNVIATTGVVPADFMEEQVALQYMPAKTTQELQALFYPKNNVPSLLSAAQIGFTAVQAWRAGSAVKEYRESKGKAYKKPWYDFS